MKRFFLTPAVHFFLIGSLLFAVERLWQTSRPPREELLIPASRIERLREGFHGAYGQPPGPAEDRALIQRAIDEEVLFHRALAAGLDRDNGFIRDRLLTVMEFLNDNAQRSEASLLEEARVLGLDRSDPVIRRSLVETMELVASRVGGDDPVTEAELRAAYEQHAGSFEKVPSIRLSQLFLSRSRRGAALAENARALMHRLKALRLDPGAAASQSDPFPYGTDFPLLAEVDLDRRFGSPFVTALAGQPERQWIGPLESSYGLHLVWIHERRPAERLPFESVRDRLERLIRYDRGKEHARRTIAEWRKQYDVRVELPEKSRTATLPKGGLG